MTWQFQTALDGRIEALCDWCGRIETGTYTPTGDPLTDAEQAAARLATAHTCTRRNRP